MTEYNNFARSDLVVNSIIFIENEICQGQGLMQTPMEMSPPSIPTGRRSPLFRVMLFLISAAERRLAK